MMKNTIFILCLSFSIPFFGQQSVTDSIPAPLIDSLFSESDTLSTKQSIFDFISQKEILEMKITANFDTLLENKKKLRDYIPGKISFVNELGEDEDAKEKITLKVNIKPRGKYRRKICEFPPMRIKFKKKSLRKMGLRGEFNTLKLVTHCLDDKKSSKENVLREFLIYKLYNLHAEHSLRAQLVKIKYVQSGSKKKLFERYGILLENDKEMAYRTNTHVVDTMYCSADSLSIYESTVHSLFQCMIGNADWTLMGMRNVKVVRLHTASSLCIYPYDFDCAGLVNASYAIPNPDYKLTSTRQRVFLGKIHSDEEMIKVARHFLEKKDETLDMCKNFKMLSKSSRRDITKYLKSFYKILKNETNLSGELIKISPKK